ncbi:MAG: glycosyltransferase, partial [Bacteroidales bacterium]
MKIAILSCFYPYRGGISQFNTYLLKELSKKHTVKAFNFKRQYPEFLFPGKTQYVAKNDNAVPVESEALLDTANPFSYIYTARKISEWEPDVLITRYWMSYFAPSLGYVAGRLGKRALSSEAIFPHCKRIAIMDNVIPHEHHFFDAPLTKYFIRRNDGFVLLSNAVKDDLIELSPNSQCITIHHPLYSNFGEQINSYEARKALNIPGADGGFDKLSVESRKVLLFFGLIRDYKGLDILLNAMPLLDKSYMLIVAGEPYGSFDKYQQIIDSPEFAQCRDNIIVNTNYIPDSDVKKYFSAADACVLPYRSATQSGISSISWNFNVPLITTPVGGLVESVGKAGTGLLT